MATEVTLNQNYRAQTSANSTVSYTDVHNKVSGDAASGNPSGLLARQDSWFPSGSYLRFDIYRPFLYWDTSDIPSGAVVTDAELQIYITHNWTYRTHNIVVQNGQPTYPSNPINTTSYYYSLYSGDGGSIASSAISTNAWNTITLNDDGKDWINCGGETKLALRVSRDIDSDSPGIPSEGDAARQEGIRLGSDGTYAKLVITYNEITTEAATQISYQCAMGNGTIVAGEPTERGFEIRLSFSGTLNNYIQHSIAGFEGDVTWDIVNKWHGTLTKTESETGTFEPEAYELVLGYPSVLGNPSSVFNDKLFKCESYTYRACMVIDEVTYCGDYVGFDTLCDSGEDQQPTDDISDGDPTVPIIPIDPDIDPYPPFPGIDPEEPDPYPPFPEIPYPDWDPDYPPWDWVGDFYYRKPYTKKDLDELRKKCIIYNKNSIEFALVLRHNMNVLKEFFNMMTDYMSKEEFNDFTDLIPPQNLKELYLDPLNPTDFRDMINGFIRNTIDNNIAVNRNFSLIQAGLSEYETESDDAYFREITSSIKSVTEDNPDVHRLKRKIDSLNREVAFNFGNIMHNLKIIRARLL